MWQSINSSMWTVIESNLGIICASMPALKRPLSIFFPWLFAKATRTDDYRYGSSTCAVQGSAAFFSKRRVGTYARGPKGILNSTSAWHDRLAKDRLKPESYDLQELGDCSSRDSQDRMLETKERQGDGLRFVMQTTEVNVEYDASNNPFVDPARYRSLGSLGRLRIVKLLLYKARSTI